LPWNVRDCVLIPSTIRTLAADVVAKVRPCIACDEPC